jgi:hypothetical protein
MASAPPNTLLAIEGLVRQITRNPSEAQLTTVELDNFINTFILYDFPESLRLFNLRQTFSFYCNAFQDTYLTDTSLSVSDPLFNFQNQYISVHPPFYVAGYQTYFTQSRESFYQKYPQISSIQILTQGDGATSLFSGFLSTSQTPIRQNFVLFDSIDANFNTMSLVDTPIDIESGNLGPPGAIPAVSGTINYITGQYNFTFVNPPGVGENVNAQTQPYVPSIPQAILYFDNQFLLRPIPDQAYQIQFEVYARPSFLMSSSSVPQLEQWWQYIAYGAAIKVFQSRADFEGVEMIMKEFNRQERFVLRQTLMQIGNERTATIYTESMGGMTGGFGWNGWGNF